jgi:hypothetical protein
MKNTNKPASTPETKIENEEIAAERLRVESTQKAGIFGNSQWSDLNGKNDYKVTGCASRRIRGELL